MREFVVIALSFCCLGVVALIAAGQNSARPTLVPAYTVASVIEDAQVGTYHRMRTIQREDAFILAERRSDSDVTRVSVTGPLVAQGSDTDALRTACEVLNEALMREGVEIVKVSIDDAGPVTGITEPCVDGRSFTLEVLVAPATERTFL